MRDQEIGFAALYIMTTWNVLLGILMIFEIIPLYWGMGLAFVGMFGIIYKSWRMLMGDVRPWDPPKEWRERINKK